VLAQDFPDDRCGVFTAQQQIAHQMDQRIAFRAFKIGVRQNARCVPQGQKNGGDRVRGGGGLRPQTP
jgi:hypothetical protein